MGTFYFEGHLPLCELEWGQAVSGSQPDEMKTEFVFFCEVEGAMTDSRLLIWKCRHPNVL